MTALRIGAAALGLATVLLAGAFGWIRYGGAAPTDFAALSELVLLIERTARTRAIEAGQVQARTTLDYDGLVRVSRELDTAKEALKGRVAKLPPADRRLARALRRLVLAVESQDEVVERYKTDLAAILGSRRYLPEAGDAIRHLAEKMEPARREATASLRRETDELLLALRGPYEESRSPELLGRLTERLRVLDANSAQAGGALGAAVAEIVRHARVVLERSEPVRRGFERLSGETVEDQAAAAAGALDRAAAERAVRAGYRELAFGSGAFALALGWAGIGLVAYRRRRARGAVPVSADADEVAYEAEVEVEVEVANEVALGSDSDRPAEPPTRPPDGPPSVPAGGPLEAAALATLASAHGAPAPRIVGAPAPLPLDVAEAAVGLAARISGARLILAEASGGTVLSAHVPADVHLDGAAVGVALDRLRAAGAGVAFVSHPARGATVRIAAPRPERASEPENHHG